MTDDEFTAHIKASIDCVALAERMKAEIPGQIEQMPPLVTVSQFPPNKAGRVWTVLVVVVHLHAQSDHENVEQSPYGLMQCRQCSAAFSAFEYNSGLPYYRRPECIADRIEAMVEAMKELGPYGKPVEPEIVGV